MFNIIIVKWVLTIFFWGAGLVSPTITSGYFTPYFDEMDAQYKCAYGQEGFTEDDYDDGWWWTKAYLKMIAIDMGENYTFFYQLDTLAMLQTLFTDMAAGKMP